MKQPLKLTTRQGERIAVVAGLRTPFAKQATAFHGVPAVDLGKLVVSEMLARTDLDPKLIDQLVFGQVVQMPEAPNIAREIVLGTGMSVSTDAYSVSRACATSFQAVANVTESIMAGTVDIAIAGGADSSSVLPIGVSKTLARALVDLNKARNLQQRFNILRRLRLKDLLPVPPAVAEYSTGLSMGQTAEQMAKSHQISREAQDAFALASLARALALFDIAQRFARPEFREDAKREWRFAMRNQPDESLLAAAEIGRQAGFYDMAIYSADRTVNLHDFLIGVRGGLATGTVERIIRVDARGALS